jgi:hypothetical protein
MDSDEEITGIRSETKLGVPVVEYVCFGLSVDESANGFANEPHGASGSGLRAGGGNKIAATTQKR